MIQTRPLLAFDRRHFTNAIDDTPDEKPKRARGRPKKEVSESEVKVSKPRGRPRKAKSEEPNASAGTEEPVKKKRGRPPKKDSATSEEKKTAKPAKAKASKAKSTKSAASEEKKAAKPAKTKAVKAKPAKSETKKPKKSASETKKSTKSVTEDGMKITIKDASAIKRKYESFRKRFDMTDEQFENLNEQDVSDLRQIQQLEEIAKFNDSGKAKVIHKESKSATEIDELLTLEETQPDSRRPPKSISDEKDYLQMTELADGGVDVKLFLPPFDLEYLKQGVSKQLTISISASDRR